MVARCCKIHLAAAWQWAMTRVQKTATDTIGATPPLGDQRTAASSRVRSTTAPATSSVSRGVLDALRRKQHMWCERSVALLA